MKNLLKTMLGYKDWEYVPHIHGGCKTWVDCFIHKQAVPILLVSGLLVAVVLCMIDKL